MPCNRQAAWCAGPKRYTFIPTRRPAAPPARATTGATIRCALRGYELKFSPPTSDSLAITGFVAVKADAALATAPEGCNRNRRGA